MFKAQLQQENGEWRDVRGPNGKPLLFENNADAHAKLAELYPVIVEMEKYVTHKRTRVYKVLEDQD